MPPAEVRAVMTSPARARIAHVLPWRNVGGTEIATLRLARAAAEHGYDSTVFHLHGADPVRDLFASAGFAVERFEAITPSYRSARRYLRGSRALAHQFRELGIDLVHCADVRSAFHAGLAGTLARIPVICHVRNRYRDLSRRDRSFLWQVNHFVFVSHETWRTFARDVSRDRGSVLYDGVDVPPPPAAAGVQRLRSQLGIPVDAPVAGMVARVAPQKDFETLIDAAARVVRDLPDARFVVVGDHESVPDHRRYHGELIARLRSEGLEDRFFFTGHRDDVPALLDAFDVFVLSTHWEGFPLAILEAMSHGLPVVATAVDGIPEVVQENRTGLLFEEGDADTLSRHLLRLLTDRDLASRLGAAGRQRIEVEYSGKAYVRNVGALYERVLGSSSKRRSA